MKVKDIMGRNVVTISERATIREAVALLSTRGVSGLPVVNNGGVMVGVVTEHDIIKAVLPTYEDIVSLDASMVSADLMATRVYAVRDNSISTIMTRNVATLSEDDTVLKAASTMIARKVKRLPVVADGKPIGIVSRIDIVEAVMSGAM